MEKSLFYFLQKRTRSDDQAVQNSVDTKIISHKMQIHQFSIGNHCFSDDLPNTQGVAWCGHGRDEAPAVVSWVVDLDACEGAIGLAVLS